jgi:hypothetical protein
MGASPLPARGLSVASLAMGGHPYWYFVPYRKDVQGALDALRKREFKAGRYSPVIRYLKFSEPAFSKQKPGAEHETIEDAIEDSAEEGTRSILDIAKVGAEPDDGTASPVPPEDLKALYETDQPTRKQVEDDDMALLEAIDRGQCRYVVLYDKGKPSELLFAGYSYD